MNNRSLPQIVALTFGAIYLLVGILGLIPLWAPNTKLDELTTGGKYGDSF